MNSTDLIPACGINYLILAAIIVAAASSIQASFGFGFSMLSAPVLALVDRAFVPGPLIILGLIISFRVWAVDFQHVDTRSLKIGLPIRLLGIIAGTFTLRALGGGRAFDLAFASLILVGLLLSLLGRINKTNVNIIVATFVSGVMGVVTSAGGPPMALLHQNDDARTVRSTLSIYFAVGGVVALTGLTLIGELGSEQLLLSAWMAGPCLLGISSASLWKDRVTRGWMRLGVIAFSAASTVAILIRDA